MTGVDVLNESKARIVIQELIKSSVRHFFIAPGSRSTPLALAASENPLAKTVVHFDERGLGFAALGCAKATQNPVCIICTSGTAVANLYPAIMESAMSFTPLIILSADRPYELRDVGANQTVDQVKAFGSYLRFEVDMPLSDSHVPDSFIARTASHAAFRAKNNPAGPVLINIMLREPLLVSGKRKLSLNEDSFLPETTYHISDRQLKEESIASIAKDLSKHEKGVIVVGALPPTINLEAIYALAMKLQWPIFADPLSNVRSMGRDSSLIPFYNHLLQTTYSSAKLIPDSLLYLGGAVVSKTLLEWLKTFTPQKFYHVANSPYRHDPNHQVTDRIEMDPVIFCQDLFYFLKGRSPSIWLSIWKEYSLHIEEVLCDFFEESVYFSEPHTVFSLLNSSPSSSFFFSNSLPIRYADTFFFPKEPTGFVFGNRGVSGIDGILASSIGIAEGLNKPLIAFVGDLAFLHDLNSLILAKQRGLPITFVVLNNSGGGIFHFLPVAENKKFLDGFVATKHSIKMEGFAKAFQIPYLNPKSLSEYEKALSDTQESLRIIEIETNAEENYLFHQQIESYVRKRMTKSKKEKNLYLTLKG